MVHIVCGEKGKGKTKVILEKANEAIKTSGGNVVFLDKDLAHSGEFIGFLCGIISQDHDLEASFLDSFLKISFTDKETMKPVLDKIIQVADKYSVDVILSLSVKSEDVPEEYKHNILVSL